MVYRAPRRAAAEPVPPPEDVVEVFHCEQRSEEWYALRMGLVTASVLSEIMADSDEQKGRRRLLYRLAGELLSGEPVETYTNAAMQRGIMMEPEALDHYAFTRGVELTRVGFVRRTIKKMAHDLVIGCSPDALVGADGIVQIKTMQPDLLAELIDRGRVPTEHRWQCHGEMWAAGRQWCDLKIFWPKMYSPVFRFERDEAVIRQMDEAVERFYWDLRQVLERIRRRK